MRESGQFDSLFARPLRRRFEVLAQITNSPGVTASHVNKQNQEVVSRVTEKVLINYSLLTCSAIHALTAVNA